MKIKRIVFTALFICMLLTGCTNTYYTDEQCDKIVAEGKVLITEYLNNNYSEYKLKNCGMLIGAKIDTNPYAGYYTSDYVEGIFTADGKDYTIDVNIKTGEIYSSEQNEALCDYIEEKLKPYIEDAGYEAEIIVDNIQLEYEVISKGVQSGKEILDTQIFLHGVMPVKYNPDNFDELISENNTSGDFFSMFILFHEDETGHFPNDAVKKFREDYKFFDKGIVYVYNLYAEDFNDILAGNKNYHYSMKKIEDYSILSSFTDETAKADE